jgi:transcriptional regulator with XRE-family HTH domain
MTPHPLKVERELRGWSQAKVAKILGTTTRTIGRWEQGQAIPYPHYREQLCALFGKDALALGISMKSDENKSATESRTLMETAITTPDEQDTAPSTYLLDPAIPQIPGRAGDLFGRDDLLLQTKQSLLNTNRFPALAFHGLPGVGKTALAVALAMDQQVQAHFCDGILWGSLGPGASTLDQLIRWGALLGISPDEVKNANSCASWRRALRMLIGSRRLLIIIDDAWSAEDALALQIGGAYCAHILTTRQPQVAFAFAQEGATQIPELEEDNALALLARFVPLLAQQTSEDVLTLVRAVAGLPLALTLLGKYLARQAFTGQPRRLQSAITRLQAVEQRFHMSTPIALTESSSGQSSSAPISIYTTIASSEQRLSESARAALCALAVFPPKPASFSESAALAVSQQPVEALDELWDAGLLESSEPGRYTLHRIISDFARLRYDDTEARTRLVRLSSSLLSSPQLAGEKIESSIATDGKL